MIEFHDFVAAHAGTSGLPDWAKIDLMEIPHLVPNIFVHDYRAGTENGLLVMFSGTAIDENQGQVVQGNYLENVYSG